MTHQQKIRDLFQKFNSNKAQEIISGGYPKSSPVPLPDVYFDSFSYPIASIVFGDMAIGQIIMPRINKMGTASTCHK